MIQVLQLYGGKFTLFKVEGKPTVDDIIGIVKTHYANVQVGIIWNFIKGEIADFSSQDMRTIASHAAQSAKHKKTAFVGPKDIQFGILRMYGANAEMKNVPPIMKAFRTMEDAIDWLNE